ncbi:MAG: flagellar hook-basal body complex protein [Alphaproteobacteria bacterium]|nr:flagellar hook-basal body complex protein [Alphaproteobacteria bacterium]
MALASFTPSTTGLAAQSQALSTVSTNIANISTVGYRSVETMFQTLLGHTPSTGNTRVGNSASRVAINGVTAYDRTLISQQGVVASTGGNYDVAIDINNGFFQVEDAVGDIYYTRAGNFTTRTQDGTTYLVGNNGYFVDGFKANPGGGFAGGTSKIEFDAPEVAPSVPTTKVSIQGNVPASGVDRASYSFQVYGANNDGNVVNLVLHKDENENNIWHVSYTMPNGTVVADPVDVIFDGNGQLVSPQTLALTVTADDGDVNNVTLDISKMTQYAGDETIIDISQDGAPSSSLSKTYIDTYGVLQAEYADGRKINIAKLAVVAFQSPENLIQLAGTMFEASNDTGESRYVIGPDTVTSTVLTSQAVESSPVSVEAEFSNLIIIQRAYTLNTTSFTTNNEMLQTAVDILS